MTEPDITRYLRDWRDGDEAVLEQLMPLAFDEFHKLARIRFALERKDHTLQPTALINECYMRLSRGSSPDLKNRPISLALRPGSCGRS